MSKSLIIAEKPSVAADLARALGKVPKQGGHYENDQYVISSAVGHVAAHELGAAAYAIRAARAAATEDDSVEAGRLECQWQRAQLPREIRELVLDDQRLRNELCWFAFDC